MVMRFPVVSRRRWVQHTALGAAEVPDVKSRIVAVGEATRHENATGEIEPVGHGSEKSLVPGLGDHQLHVGVGDVPGQMLVAPGVVESDQGRPYEAGTTQCEHVVRSVVEQDGDMGRTVGIEPGPEQRGEPLRPLEQLTVGPHLIAEAQGRPHRKLGIGSVSSEEDRRVGRRKRGLAGRGGQSHPLGHVRRGHHMRAGPAAFTDHGVRLGHGADR
jgi:hypothetical protein